MTEKLAAFDLEIATIFPEGETDWKSHRPLGITCAAIATPRGVWTYAATDERGRYAERMTGSQCRELVDDLRMLQAGGYKILTWNGLAFDFDVLSEECAIEGFNTYYRQECAELALSDSHIDMMYHFFTANGYPISLDKAARGAGLAGKPTGIDGALAPIMWENGVEHEHADDCEAVLDYVRSDAQQTLDLYLATTRGGGVKVNWLSSKGNPMSWTAPRWLPTTEARQNAIPTKDFMSFRHEDAARWALDALGEEPA